MSRREEQVLYSGRNRVLVLQVNGPTAEVRSTRKRIRTHSTVILDSAVAPLPVPALPVHVEQQQLM